MKIRSHIKNSKAETHEELNAVDEEIAEKREESRDMLVSRMFCEHNEALLRFLRARLPSAQDAEEVAQEAYVRMLRLDDTDTISHLQAYLFRIAANIAVDRNRQQKRKPYEEKGAKLWDSLPSALPSLDDSVLSKEKLTLLGGIISELPPKCRMAFMLYKFKDMSYSDVAEKMQLSESMIRKYVLKAIIYCRERLEEEQIGTGRLAHPEPLHASYEASERLSA